MTADNEFTPTQQRLLAILADGLPHPPADLTVCLDDELSDFSVVQKHISNIRKVIRPKGQEIVCEIYNRTIHYRHVRLLLDPYSGKK